MGSCRCKKWFRVVHIAPGCGQRRLRTWKELGASAISPIDSTGRFLEGYGDLTGIYAHDVSDIVVDTCRTRDCCLKQKITSTAILTVGDVRLNVFSS